MNHRTNVKIRKTGRAWGWHCRACLNMPGWVGARSWTEALMLGWDHVETHHPQIDWSSWEAKEVK